MKHKVAYNNKRVFRKTILSQQEHDVIIQEGNAAEAILQEPRFSFFRQLLESMRSYAEKSILENTITDVSEEVTISESVRRVFSKSKKEQVDGLSGQYVLINKIFSDLEERVRLRDDLMKGISEETILIQNEQ